MFDPMSRLRTLMNDAARGVFPEIDGEVEVLDVPGGPDVRETVVEFTGHAVVATGRSPESVRDAGADGFGGATSPAFLDWFTGEHGHVEHHGVMLAALGEGVGRPEPTTEWDGHPRVALACETRREVAVFGDEHCCVTLGRGLAGRWEVGVETDPDRRTHGAGRPLVDAVRRSVARGEPVFATVAPGNARALRTMLGAGFRPIGAEVAIRRRPPAGGHV